MSESSANKSSKKEVTTHEEAAKLVVRRVEEPVKDKDGKVEKDDKGKVKTRVVEKAVSAKEVMAFKDYGDFVVVVTTDGQKLRGAK